MVTAGDQRDRWGLPDLAASGRVRVADEGEALGPLRDGSGGPAAVDEPPVAGGPAPGGGRTAAAALEIISCTPDSRAVFPELGCQPVRHRRAKVATC